MLEEKDNLNGVQQLSREATGVNQSFSQQVLQEGPSHDCGQPNPFPAEGKEQLASTAYRSGTCSADRGHSLDGSPVSAVRIQAYWEMLTACRCLGVTIDKME